MGILGRVLSGGQRWEGYNFCLPAESSGSRWSITHKQWFYVGIFARHHMKGTPVDILSWILVPPGYGSWTSKPSLLKVLCLAGLKVFFSF